jgi:hypothetical protein
MAGSSSISPSIADLTLYAFQLVGLRPSSLIQEHIESARMATNMLLARWSAQGINLWQIQKLSQPLKKGVGMYGLPGDIVGLLDTYVSQPDGGGGSVDRIMMPISRTEYASYPKKLQQGFPTVYWFNQILEPNRDVRITQLDDTRITQPRDRRVTEPVDNLLYIWPTPQSNDLILNFYYMKQLPAVSMQGVSGPQVPMYFLEAFAYGLASRLAMIWAPEKAGPLKSMADEAYQIAEEQNVEDASYYITPQLSGYFRA